MDVFERFGIPRNFGTNPNTKKEFENSPLRYTNKNPGKAYHGKARGKQLMTLDVQDSGFQQLMAELGKVSKYRGKAVVEFIIYNDASRKASQQERESGEGDRVFYAKFVEYGYLWRGSYYVPGKRLFSKIRKKIKRRLVANYRAMPKQFLLRDLEKAMEDTVKWTIQELERITPVDSGHMQESWKYVKNKGK